MAIHQYKVYHFHEYIEAVKCIGESMEQIPHVPPVLWSRGHRKQTWNLRPTLLRDIVLDPIGKTGVTSGRAMAEELRKQHYIAKNYHFLEKEPKTSLEWYEVMQHHGVKTRLLDWSESAIHSLVFALECFFDNKQYRSSDRINCSPCVWLFNPVEWNIKALKLIMDNEAVIETCVKYLHKTTDSERTEINKRMNQLRNLFREYISPNLSEHLKGIFNLSSIAEMLQPDLIALLIKGELYYCLFYLLVQIYLTTEQCKISQILPLSIVESYHSERIRAQKGAFTIFPYYEEDTMYSAAASIGVRLDSMEYMQNGNDLLHQIKLCNPDEIAFEVMNAGVNVSWLYPEMPVVANAIEQREVFY